MAITVNIDEKYCHLKAKEPIIVLTKSRSPHVTEYYEDPTDNWFIYVMTKTKKTGAFTHCSIVIRKDCPSWVRYAVSQGWSIIVNNSDILNTDDKRKED
jgi:hypothetical protein